MSHDEQSKMDAKHCLLHAAARLFAKLGLDRTSTRDISKESKANISLISYHFGGKEGLYKEVIREFALEIQEKTNEMFKAFENVELTRETFIDEVGQIVDKLISMRLNHREISVILAREKIEGMQNSREIHEEIFYPAIKNFFTLFKAAQLKGIVKPDLNPAVFFICLTEGILGFYEIMDCKTLVRTHCEHFVTDQKALKEHVLKIYLQGALA